MTKPPVKSSRNTKSEAERRLDEIIRLTISTAKAKGWRAFQVSRDNKEHRYASVGVEKYFSPNEVTATLDITCHKVVKLAPTQTSFYGYGLQDLRDAIWEEISDLSFLQKDDAKPSNGKPETSETAIVARLLRRFHRAARQLKNRYNERPGLLLNDEYDVQDLLHVLLRSLFDDIRTEEYCPSYAGGASRIDFLLKSESIAIEVKVASPALRDKKIGEQLLIDVQRYQAHPGCKTLFCLVYDPYGELRNPAGLEADLTKKYDTLDVRVVVVSPA